MQQLVEVDANQLESYGKEMYGWAVDPYDATEEDPSSTTLNYRRSTIMDYDHNIKYIAYTNNIFRCDNRWKGVANRGSYTRLGSAVGSISPLQNALLDRI